MNLLPTALTVSRIFSVLLLLAFFSWGTTYGYVAAGVILLFAALTDVLDGYLARRLQCSSDIGGFLDGVADRVLIVVCLLCLVSADAASLYSVALLSFRELLVDSMRSFMAKSGVVMPHNVFGRLKMSCVVVAMVLGLLSLCGWQIEGIASRVLVDLLLLLALSCGIISAGILMRDSSQRLRGCAIQGTQLL